MYVSDSEIDQKEDKCEEVEDKMINFPEDIPFVLKHCKLINEELIINIRREYAFEDFKKFFMKKWNQKNLNKIYEISLIGVY